ncbi:MAG: DEAD/DEAH box helicase, partial [Cyanobacteria bacterium CAN_BIN43]|nr:DEAD/DEAH box helicase [Cyanobacteria bacterium CAN_BIN43]
MTKLTHTYSLRPYQDELIQSVFAQWTAGNRRVLAQSPTGSGKTVCFSAIAAEFTAKGEGVLVLAHREELILQAAEKLTSVTAQPVGIIKAGYRPDPTHQIQVASVQSLIRRRDRPSAGLVIIDEAHHSPANSYQEILSCYPEAYILGVTATPARSDGQGFKKQYDALVLGWSVRRLIDAGFLCSFRLFAAKKCIKAADVKLTAGDYNQRELAELVNTTLTLGDVVGTWKKHALGRKTVVFCVDVSHSEAVAEGYQQAGFAAEHLDGESSTSERSEALERFRTGETQILVNCALFTEGLDIPDIECV